jgi:outer membrane protein assembly factor BamE (lipoprotein component of BamABCDE complex)
MIERAVIALAVLSLWGCASSGNRVLEKQDATAVNQQIVDGKTTRPEVVATYGQPSQTSLTDAGNEVWTYTFAHATSQPQNFIPIVGIFAGGMDVQKKELVILFDKDGIVVKHTMNIMKTSVQRGG